MVITDGLGCIKDFIGIAKEISQIKRMVLPDYQQCSKDLYKICQKILTPNDNLIVCFNQFLYHSFSEQNAQSDFNQRVADYQNSRKVNIRQFKFSCSALEYIYFQNIENKIGNIFSDKSKLEDVAGIFQKLISADADMLITLEDNVLKKLDNYIEEVEGLVNTDQLGEAEEKRLEFKQECKEMLKELNDFSNELSGLTITFAKLAQIPLTLDETQ